MIVLWIVLAVVFKKYYEEKEEEIYLTLYRIFKALAIIDGVWLGLLIIVRCATLMSY